ncbi:hypothetical protein H9L12_04645 [Sphingomonas rhizophila]|uniref:Uncharacterized protein n=1 Tax=Sphingomonas rhizophila TaxID=2071607 RepID=A0A7G9SDA7_9SPHN|nr:hypothetical protein [Sphingomonas rhizophila]QNN65832.1 hypothetical protein H9L12_04645 [Sphingomonas rhizophila]
MTQLFANLATTLSLRLSEGIYGLPFFFKGKPLAVSPGALATLKTP